MFHYAMNILLKHEGGLTTDHAGFTNFGITVPVLREAAKLFSGLDIDGDGDIDADDIRLLSVEQAVQIYKKLWWDRYEYYRFRDRRIAAKVLDLSVNMGPRQAHKIFQRALRSIGLIIDDDGHLGPISFTTINSVEKVQQYLCGCRCEAAGFYRGITYMHPDYKKYLSGWLNRAYNV